MCTMYVPFFDLKVAISDIIFTAHNLLIYQKRALECDTRCIERGTSLTNLHALTEDIMFTSYNHARLYLARGE